MTENRNGNDLPPGYHERLAARAENRATRKVTRASNEAFVRQEKNTWYSKFWGGLPAALGAAGRDQFSMVSRAGRPAGEISRQSLVLSFPNAKNAIYTLEIRDASDSRLKQRPSVVVTLEWKGPGSGDLTNVEHLCMIAGGSPHGRPTDRSASFLLQRGEWSAKAPQAATNANEMIDRLVTIKNAILEKIPQTL